MNRIIGGGLLIGGFAFLIFVCAHGFEPVRKTALSHLPTEYFDFLYWAHAINAKVNGRPVPSPRAKALATAAVPRPAVEIASVRFQPNMEIVLRSDARGGNTIDVTGWKLKNAKGNSFILPQGYELYGSSPLGDIRLGQGEMLRVVARPGDALAMRLNRCTGLMGNLQSYAICASAGQHEPGFYFSEWQAAAPSGLDIFSFTHDKVRLYDRNGALIDEYVY